MHSEANARRLALADEIMTLEYRTNGAGWLKVIPVADVAGRRGTSMEQRERLVADFFSRHFYNWTPEDSPYSDFNDGTWTPCERAEVARVLDEIVAVSEARVQRDAEEAAEQRASAEEGGDAPEPADWGSSFSDYAAMRRWFEQLWPGPDVGWFVLTGAREGLRAVGGVDDLLVGVAWVE